MDADALVTQWFDEHANAVFRYLALAFRSEQDAEEVTQETFLRLHIAVLEHVEIKSPRGWAIRVAQRLMIDRLRGRERRDHVTVNLNGDAVDVIDTAANPHEVLEQRQRLTILWAAMRSLTDLERQMLYARAEGLTLKQIGAVHGMALQRVGEIVTRAIDTLHAATSEGRTTERGTSHEETRARAGARARDRGSAGAET